MRIAHLSDFHICRFGTRFTQIQDVARRPANGKGWVDVHDMKGWTIQSRTAAGRPLQFRDLLRLVDADGVVHKTVKLARIFRRHSEFDKLIEYAKLREASTPQALSENFPDQAATRLLLQRDPENINLRFCQLAHQIRGDNPDHLIITGDLTDDAVGLDLVLVALAPFIARRAVSCVPGNHDLYPSPPLWVAKEHRCTELDKRARWQDFAQALDFQPFDSQLTAIGDGIVLARLNSCHRPAVPASASGLVKTRDLETIKSQLAGQRNALRLACLHHHVLNPPIAGLGIPPIEAGMRLRNAKEVYTWLQRNNFAAAFNGHRHVGYRFHPAAAPLFVSAPSSTIGCRSGLPPFYWIAHVTPKGIESVTEHFVKGIERNER